MFKCTTFVLRLISARGGSTLPGRALNALVLSSGEDSPVIVPTYAADQLLPTGSGAEGRLEGRHAFSVCHGEAATQPPSMPVFFQVLKHNAQTWNQHKASARKLLNTRLPDSSQLLTFPRDSRVAVILLISLETDSCNASPSCDRKCL